MKLLCIEKSKKTGKDELQFMKRLETWLGDLENIESMITNSKNSNDGGDVKKSKLV